MKCFKYKTIALALATVFTVASCGSDDSNAIVDDPTPVEDQSSQEPSVARQWNEVILEGIRNDFARPTVHARNLFHSSAAMYDAWYAFSEQGKPYLLGNSLNGYDCGFESFSTDNVLAAQEEAISYATYRLIQHRFKYSPDKLETFELADQLMSDLGYDVMVESTDYSEGSAAALGNHIANCYIDYGFKDGSKEDIFHANVDYQPMNEALQPELPGNPNLSDMDRWQSLDLGTYIDQSGNEVEGAIEFLGAEWGEVTPFSLSEDDLTVYERDGHNYYVYHDPGMPPTHEGEQADNYKWTFSLVSKWSSHLDPNDGVMIDISPASQGNIDINDMPANFDDHYLFYNDDGGDMSKGYSVNPSTDMPYETQMVPRGDYARVLAEFWADGPDSETPPGHWFVILNTVTDHELFERKWAGEGEELDALEYDVKAYFSLGGTMHDSAIAAWGIKGWYDYIRPVSSLRAMAELGQSSDSQLPSYNEGGIPLDTGLIELVGADDDLAGENGENIGKIKVLAWRGPDYIADPETDIAGVDWILAENWWPYQRPSFVTPPFAGYVSGHSTFSRAAAELMTTMTGSSYFPGGMSDFKVSANDFLVFEQGPSVDLILQWATYRDASDQCSLSRIWGGIHPPADDIPGRLIGEKIGKKAFSVANSYF